MYTSLRAFPYVAVATVVVFRNLSTCVVAFFDGFLLNEPLGKRRWVAVCLMLAGVVLYAGKDMNYDRIGYLWLTGNSAVFSFNMLYNRHFIKKSDQTPDGVNFIQQTCMVPLIIGWAFFTEEITPSMFFQFDERSYFRQSANSQGSLSQAVSAEVVAAHESIDNAGDARLEDKNPFMMILGLENFTLGVLFATCVGGCVIGAVYAECYKRFSATQVTVASNVLKLVSVLMDCFLFSSKLSIFQSCGLMLSIVAGLWYSVLPKPQQLRKPTAENSPNSKDSGMYVRA